MGDKEHTIQELERMAVLGPVRLGRDLNYPEFNLVRGDPRIHALRSGVAGTVGPEPNLSQTDKHRTALHPYFFKPRVTIAVIERSLVYKSNSQHRA